MLQPEPYLLTFTRRDCVKSVIVTLENIISYSAFHSSIYLDTFLIYQEGKNIPFSNGKTEFSVFTIKVVQLILEMTTYRKVGIYSRSYYSFLALFEVHIIYQNAATIRGAATKSDFAVYGGLGVRTLSMY